MSKKRYYISLICLLMLCTSIYSAEIVTTTHNFHAMSSDKTQIEFLNDNTIAETPLLTYTTDNAKFGLYTGTNPNPICILMNTTDATVTTTQIDNLKTLIINYYYEGRDAYDEDNIGVLVSLNGKDWNTPDEIIYNKGLINVVLPTGDYYLQIKRKNKNFYIHQIEYTTEKCACFPYIKPE